MRRTTIPALVTASLVALLPACTSDSATTGEYTYLTGDLVSHEAASFERAWEAAQAAVTDLQFEVKEKVKDALDAKLVAKQADGSEAVIKLARNSDSVTRISVRVGLLGDETRSRIIMDKIKSKL